MPAASVAAYPAPEIARAQSMGLDETFGHTQPDYNMSYYGALSLATSIHHASPQLLDLGSSVHSNSPYLGEMAMAPLPIAQSFSMPSVPHDTPPLSVDTSFVAGAEDAASSAFELYTTASDHDELASSLVSASLVAASLSTLMASSQPVASVSEGFSAAL
ncbi:hypothetical protein IWW55_005718, partial [Coemansia sp. RSA 2706]